MFFLCNKLLSETKLIKTTFPEPGKNNVRASMFGKQQADKQDYEEKKTTEGGKTMLEQLELISLDRKTTFKKQSLHKLCCFCSAGSLFLLAPSFLGTKAEGPDWLHLDPSPPLSTVLKEPYIRLQAARIGPQLIHYNNWLTEHWKWSCSERQLQPCPVALPNWLRLARHMEAITHVGSTGGFNKNDLIWVKSPKTLPQRLMFTREWSRPQFGLFLLQVVQKSLKYQIIFIGWVFVGCW